VKTSKLAGIYSVFSLFTIWTIIILFGILYQIEYELTNFYFIIFSFAAIAIPFLFLVFGQFYKAELRKRQVEKYVPDILLQASIFPKGTSLLHIIAYFGEAKYGHLSKEFSRASMEIKKGATVEAALENIKNRYKESRILARAINLLIQGYNSGADMNQTFKEAADDLMQTNTILRERAASMTVEKFTLLIAGAFLVPFILGMITKTVSSFDLTLLSTAFGEQVNLAEKKEMLAAALLGTHIYIFEYAILASIFVANQENNIKKAVIYATILIPVSLLVFTLAKGI